MVQPIRVGVFNWSDFCKEGDYYPEDMPVEWRLSYFSNDFETACIDFSCCDSDPSRLLDWVDDLPETFELSLKLTRESQLETLVDCCTQLSFRLHYLLVSDDMPTLIEKDASMQQALSDCSVAQQIMPASTLWTPDQSNQVSPVARLPGRADLRQYRAWIEQWLAVQPSETLELPLTLWLEGTDATYSTVMELRTLVELMGH